MTFSAIGDAVGIREFPKCFYVRYEDSGISVHLPTHDLNEEFNEMCTEKRSASDSDFIASDPSS